MTGTITNAKSHWIKIRTWPNDVVTRVLKINKVILTTKSRVIHIKISVPKQYQMIISSLARVKFIKIKVIFGYLTKGVSNQVLSNWNHKIKSYSCSNPSTKMGKKTKKLGKLFWVIKWDNKRITTRVRF